MAVAEHCTCGYPYEHQTWCLAYAAPVPAEAPRRDDLLKLLDEVRQCFTRDDDLPNDLLPRIDAALDGVTDTDATEQSLGLYAAQAEAIRELLDQHAPHTAGNLQARIAAALGVEVRQ
jgi:hypothetical protein